MSPQANLSHRVADRFPALATRRFKPAEVEAITGLSAHYVRQIRSRGIVEQELPLNCGNEVDPIGAGAPLDIAPPGIHIDAEGNTVEGWAGDSSWEWLTQLAVIRAVTSAGIEIRLAAALAKALRLRGLYEFDWAAYDRKDDLFVFVRFVSGTEVDWSHPVTGSNVRVTNNLGEIQSTYWNVPFFAFNFSALQRGMYVRWDLLPKGGNK